jgi:prepilin-type N-terminal cleavage/methylation domain-containing protein
MNKGFTLVELAIVIVVLGILASAVVTGQSIIRSANIRAEIKNMTDMQTAVRAFELEFDDIPGDMEDAYDYFGDECGTDNDDPRTGCNGDGDKCIDQNISTNCHTGGGSFSSDERRAMVHLAVSGIMPDIEHTISRDLTGCIIGQTLPESPVESGIYFLHSNTINKIYIKTAGGTVPGCIFDINEGYLSPKDAKSIDEKIDEGNGRRGIYQARFGKYKNPSFPDGQFDGADCMDSSGNYNLSEDGVTCQIRFKIK